MNKTRLHKRLAVAKSDADRTGLERAVKTTDRKIDALVYELYGLTEEEIAGRGLGVCRPRVKD